MSDNILIQQIQNKLEGGNLSMSQVATRLNISKGHLSEIKNGKKTPGIELGLQILNLCQSDFVTKKKWVEERFAADSPEYEKLIQTEFTDRVKRKLEESVAAQIAKDLSLINIFLDITTSDSEGLEKRIIIQEYGKKGLDKCEYLKTVELIREDQYRFYGTDHRFVQTKEASYDLMNTIIHDQKERYLTKSLDGKFQFEIDDISQSGQKQLEELFGEYMKKASIIIKENHKRPSLGGKRIIFQSLMGVIKILVLGLFFVYSSSHTLAKSGGMEGGSSSRIILENFITEQEAIFKIDHLSFELASGKANILSKNALSGCRYNDKKRPSLVKVKNYKVSPYWRGGIKNYEVSINLMAGCQSEYLSDDRH